MTTVTSPAVDSMCQFAWDCLPAALNTLGLASPPPPPFEGKGKGPGGLRGFPVESSLPAKRQKTADDWSGTWTGSWADSDDEDGADPEAGYSSDTPSLLSLSSENSLDADSLADLLSLPAAVKPIFPTLDLSLGAADAAADPGRPPASPGAVSPGAYLAVVDGFDWGRVVDDSDDTDADDTDSDDDRYDDDWTSTRPLGVTLPPRRRLVSVFAVSDRWGLSIEDAAEIMVNFESAQGAAADTQGLE